MSKLFNLARVTTPTTGTGTLTLGGAVTGFLTFAQAGVSNSDVVAYAIRDGANSEIGYGTYTSSGTTLTRNVRKSTNSDAAISLSGNAEVVITPSGEDGLAPLTTRGDIVVRGASANQRLAVGANGRILASDGTDPAWVPGLTTRGDLLTRDASAYTRLALGTSGYHLQSDGTDAGWAGFLQAGTDAVTRTWQDKARDVVSAFDFMTAAQVADVKARTVGLNVTTAVQAALTATAGGALYLPAGRYLLDSSTLAKTLTGSQSLKIYGDGTDATELYFPNDGDGIAFTYTTNQFAWIGGNSIIMEDLAFVTNVQNTGSAVTVNGAAQIGDPNRPTIFNRVGFRGTLNNQSYWANGIEANDLQNLVVNDCYYFSYTLALVGTAVAYTGTVTPHPTICNVHNLNMQFGGVGVHCTGTIEGLNVTQSNLTQVDYGILVDTASALPQFSAHGNQINAESACIQITDGEACQITGNMMFVTDTGPAGNPAITGNFKYSTITGNTFTGLNAVDVPNGIILLSGATDNYIGGNVFLGFTTNITLSSGANNNRVGPNRHVNGTAVSDSGTGNIVYTETATAFSPGVSDGAALGTASLMWSDLFLATGSVINWNNGDVTLTYSADLLQWSGAAGYRFRDDLDAGTVEVRVHNSGDGNVTTKLAKFSAFGNDTLAVAKEGYRLELQPADSNLIDTELRMYVRDTDAVTLIGAIAPDGFNLASGKVLQVNATQVVSSRVTGYTAFTGTNTNRATAYDTATITLVQLAERVRALQVDLTAHGLIGA
jgi:hypothetical protein